MAIGANYIIGGATMIGAYGTGSAVDFFFDDLNIRLSNFTDDLGRPLNFFADDLGRTL